MFCADKNAVCGSALACGVDWIAFATSGSKFDAYSDARGKLRKLDESIDSQRFANKYLSARTQQKGVDLANASQDAQRVRKAREKKRKSVILFSKGKYDVSFD